MNPIPEFTETEPWTVRTALSERYGKSIELRLADSELRLNLESTTLTPGATITTTWPNVSPFCYRYRRTTNAAAISRPTRADYSYLISTP